MDGPTPRRPRPPVVRLVPPLAWMAVIAVFSSNLFGSDRTGVVLAALLAAVVPGIDASMIEAVHVALRKLGHLTEYGILAVLWRRALGPSGSPGQAGLWAVVLAGTYAVLDEARQGLAGNRSPSAWDVGIDAVGAVLAVAWYDAPNRIARASLGLARGGAAGLAAGSLAVAGLDVSLGLPAWDLVLAAIGLVLLWWGLGQVPRAWRGPT